MRYAISVSAALHAPSIAFDGPSTTDTIGRHDNLSRINIESSLLIEKLALKFGGGGPAIDFGRFVQYVG